LIPISAELLQAPHRITASEATRNTPVQQLQTRQELDCATWLHKALSLPKDQFKQEVERELNGRESEPWEIIYFKIYKTQLPVIEQAIETAALMLGTDKSRGYCLEMICADFLAGANLENEDPTVLLQSMSRFFKFLPRDQRQTFLQDVTEKAS